MSKLLLLLPTSFNKNINVKLDDVIHFNDISTYKVAVMKNYINLLVVIAIHPVHL